MLSECIIRTCHTYLWGTLLVSLYYCQEHTPTTLVDLEPAHSIQDTVSPKTPSMWVLPRRKRIKEVWDCLTMFAWLHFPPDRPKSKKFDWHARPFSSWETGVWLPPPTGRGGRTWRHVVATICMLWLHSKGKNCGCKYKNRSVDKVTTGARSFLLS